MNIKIRLEKQSDHHAVEHITREAFWNLHAPGCDEHYLVSVLRSQTCFIPELDFVAVIDDKVVGNSMCTTAKIVGDDNREHPVITIGPVSVLPKYQGMGIGSKLIEHTIDTARGLGYAAILLYGSPKYYSRFGFEPAEHYKIGTSQNTYLPALQAIELVDGALKDCAGLFYEDDAFRLDTKASDKFDKQFPQKDKQDGLDSQKDFENQVSQAKPRDK